MTDGPRPWRGIVIVLFAALAAPFILRGDIGSDLDITGIGVGLLAASAGVAILAYRGSKDPTLLYAGTAGGVVATHELFTSLVGGALNHPSTLSTGAAYVYGSLLAGATFGVLMIWAVPWRDRRGRRPPDARRALLSILGALATAEAILLIAGSSDASFSSAGVTAGLVTIAILDAIACVRLALRARRSPAIFGWFAGACLAFAILALAGLLFIGTEPILSPAGSDLRSAMAVCVGALMFVGMMSALHLERSRMRRATDRADEVLGGRAEIASVIAHDVRSPVSAIKSIAASTMANYDRLDDAQRLEFVGMIDREAQHVLAVVHQMSVALKIDAGTLDLIRRPTSIADVVREAIGEAERRGRSIEVDAAPGISADVDAKWLAEAIRQGIDNAAAFSPLGTPITMSIEDGGEGSVVVTIADEGPGIPTERREEVFHRFARWRPAGYEDVPGSGLGLFICRGIVREHGGETTLAEGPERGTILRILLPWSAD